MKSLECQSLQTRLTIRRNVIRQRVAGVNLLCRQIELYGGRISKSTVQLRKKVEAELKNLFGKNPTPLTSELLRLLNHCELLIAEERRIDLDMTRLSLENDVCLRFMGIPGVGPICALTFFAVVGEPHRFKRTTDIGSYLGLVPRLHQSGLTSRLGRISKMGNRALRTLLVHSSVVFMRWAPADSSLRSWATNVERRCGKGKARVALARKLAIVMLAMWKTGSTFELSRV
jgi:transposase